MKPASLIALIALIALCVIAVFDARAQTEVKEPGRLLELKAGYQRAVEDAVTPLKEAYNRELQKMKDSFAAAGDLDSALAIDAELKGEQSAKEIPRLTGLKENYARSARRAVGPLKTTYLQELTKLKIDLTKANALPAAQMVDAELKAQASSALLPPDMQPVAANAASDTVHPGASPLAVPSDPTAAAVHKLVSGSRWKWYDAVENFGGKAYWHEFYRDGTARNEWGRQPTWEIVPPNTLHIFDAYDNRHWYLDIDVDKKVALRNPEKDTGHNSMRYDRKASSPD